MQFNKKLRVWVHGNGQIAQCFDTPIDHGSPLAYDDECRQCVMAGMSAVQGEQLIEMAPLVLPKLVRSSIAYLEMKARTDPRHPCDEPNEIKNLRVNIHHTLAVTPGL